jgi:hypothetical protein
MLPKVFFRAALAFMTAGACSWQLLGAESEPSKPALPLSELILYSSGMGYFQRDGQVDGSTAVELQFKVEDINDLLKSMVVADLDGGQVSTVTYGSRDPLEKTLKSFGIDLTSNPSLGQLLDQLRGEQVEVHRPTPLRGTVLGVERRTVQLDEKRTLEREYLNLLTDEGLQSLRLDELTTVKLLNQRLSSELQQALQVLATGHDTQKKTVSFMFTGEGRRRVRVAYIAQTPVWKTSYRLVLGEKDKPYLQGWAIVENTTDYDWENVRLSLVSGRPISFAMDLYQPLYATRPVVEPEQYSSLRPQVYGEAMERLSDLALAAEPAVERYGGAARQAGAVGAQGGSAPEAAAAKVRTLARGARVQAELGDRMDLFAGQAAVAAAAQGTQAGELFQYAIKTPVSLSRQKSAMLPIVSENVDGEKLSIYNERVQARHPLNGFRLKNTTGLHLMQGPITVFDASAYAGDARMEDLAAGQERLISYALDIKTEVEPQSKAGPRDLLSVKLRKGTMLITRKAEEEKTYVVRNRDQKKKVVLVEHPFRAGWQLMKPSEPAERTREVYRFKVGVNPDDTATLTITEQHQISESVHLADAGPDVIAFYLRARQVDSKVKAALEKVVALRDALSRTITEKNRREHRVNEISEEQTRIRENMTRLSQTSELYNRYVKKLDEQESELETLRRDIERFRNDEARQQRELNEYLLSLDVG